MRVRVMVPRMTLDEADILEAFLKRQAGIEAVKVHERTAGVIIRYKSDRAAVIDALADFDFEENASLLPANSSRALNRSYHEKLVTAVAVRVGKQLFLPTPVRTVITVMQSVRYIVRAVRSVLRKRIEVALLDGAAIVMAMINRDFDTASSIMFLLGIGDLLEEWTYRKSVADLADAMSLGVDKVWIRTAGGEEVLIPLSEVKVGDHIVIRHGSMIPLDGKVVEGEAFVNQASMTGESLPVLKKSGGYVYAGTVVEEGECTISVDKISGGGRYDRIVKMIEDSEKLKSSTEARASHIADHLVPYSLGGTLLVGLLTRNMTKAMAVLMVDYSCALKLSMPLSVLSAMREAMDHHISVKGGRFMEAVADATDIVFDKTGTLTHASPRVAMVIPFDKQDENEMLRIAACLEEHYPHSMATAVVEEAARRGLDHEEMHSHVNYIVAHGISSTVDGKTAIIGSAHFVFEDEKCTIPRGQKRKLDAIPDCYSHLYLAIGGRLSAVICIEDPLREEARDVLNGLRALGIERCVMMTGDNEKTAARIAAEVGVDQYYSEVLPEDKAAYIERAHKEGRKVIMVGDGVNDSPALSAADAGIAISDGAAIAREIADITIAADDLRELVTLKALSNALMTRINSNYRFIMGFNSALIALGVFGVMTPAPTSLLHNTSTIAIGLKSMTNLLSE